MKIRVIIEIQNTTEKKLELIHADLKCYTIIEPQKDSSFFVCHLCLFKMIIIYAYVDELIFHFAQ